MEKLTIEFTNLMLHDRLHTLADEYSVTVESLINLAVKRLIEDVDFVRSLRTGKIELGQLVTDPLFQSEKRLYVIH